MSKESRLYTDFNEFVKNEPEAIKSLLLSLKEDSLFVDDYNYSTGKVTKRPMDTIGDMEQLISEMGRSKETIDTNYISRTYLYQTKDGMFSFEAYGDSYRKDQCVCDEEMSGSIVVTDLEMRSIRIKLETTKVLDTNKDNWDKLFLDKTLDEIKSELKEKYKFPSLI